MPEGIRTRDCFYTKKAKKKKRKKKRIVILTFCMDSFSCIQDYTTTLANKAGTNFRPFQTLEKVWNEKLISKSKQMVHAKLAKNLKHKKWQLNLI